VRSLRVFRGRPWRRLCPAVTLCGVLLLAGCDGDRGEDRVPLDGDMSRQGEAGAIPDELPPEIQARLDSGNASYRERAYDDALRHFETVTRMAPDLAAGWYGIGLTQAVLGNREAADEAMMHVHRLAPQLPLDHPSSDAPQDPHLAPPNPHLAPPNPHLAPPNPHTAPPPDTAGAGSGRGGAPGGAGAGG
jgi:tetratricopeptide (TPR) repeat protein